MRLFAIFSQTEDVVKKKTNLVIRFLMLQANIGNIFSKNPAMEEVNSKDV
jgi:hypothetical protein